jgi:hypothetical protein
MKQMIASFTNNFVFIKTRKTAGTSVEIVLSPWCSDPDIVTPVWPEDELTRIEYGGLPRNFGGPKHQRAAYIDAVRLRNASETSRLHAEMRRALKAKGFFGHMPAEQVRARLPELWERAFKFTIERHPYEKVVSRAYWFTRSHDDGRPIGEIIEHVIAAENLSDKYLYTEGDRVIVDEVFHFDSLWDRITGLAHSLGKSLPIQLPWAKGYTRADRRSARDILSISQRRKIADRCAFEFDLMGFER